MSFNGSVQRDSILSMPMAAPTMLPVVPALQSVSIPYMTAVVMVRVFSFDNLRRTPPRSTREQKALPKKSLSVRSAPHTGIWLKYRLHNEPKASDKPFPTHAHFQERQSAHQASWAAEAETAFLRVAQRKKPVLRPLRHTAMADQTYAILHIIAMEYANDLSVEQLANRCNMSVSYFRKAFCDNVGMGPQQYIIHVRLSMAEHLLRTTEKPILDIADEVGFHSLSSFNRLFLRAYGCSPRSLRARSSQMP